MILTNTLASASPAAAVESQREPTAELQWNIRDADEYFYCFQSLGRPDVVLIGGTKDLYLELNVRTLWHRYGPAMAHTLDGAGTQRGAPQRPLRAPVRLQDA